MKPYRKHAHESNPKGFRSSTRACATVRSALDEWKTARALLTGTIRSYLSACSTLRAVCVGASHRSFKSVALENLLIAVDSELDSLASEEKKLRGMRTSLSSMKNTPPKTTHINNFPPEILAHVLALSRPYCAHNGSDQVEFHDLTAVCSYWRHVAMSAADLWTHIDVGPETPAGLTNLLLARTRDAMIDVHVYEPTLRGHKKADETIGILAPHIRRIRTLNIKSHDWPQDYAGATLNLWLNNGNPSVARSLMIHQPNQIGLLSANIEESGGGTVSKNAYGMIRSLNTLHLQGATFGWNSGAYRGLVDLRLHRSEDDDPVSISQFAEILSASPALAVLKLAYLELGHAEGWTRSTPIVMSYLSTLSLVRMDPNSLRLLLPLIYLSTSLVEISLGILVSRGMQDEFESFLMRSKITTLYYEDNDSSDSSLWRFFLHTASHHRTLILSGVRMEDAPLGEASPIFYQASSASRSPSVVLLGCGVNFEGLKSLIGSHGIQELRLDKCWVPKGRLQDLHGMKNRLLGVYPKLQCSISDTDSTRRLPCRTMFIS